jgi:TPR repeat protein
MARRVRSQQEGSKAAPFTEASRLLEQGRIQEAFGLFLRAARQGDSRAQLSVGYLYDTGRGVSRSRAQAMVWYRRAARKGEPAAANNIGTLYRDEGQLRLAIRWFSKAAELGDQDALLEMARLHAGPLQEAAAARKLLSRVLASKRTSPDNRERAQRLLSTLAEL